jgi:hypothetical protein
MAEAWRQRPDFARIARHYAQHRAAIESRRGKECGVNDEFVTDEYGRRTLLSATTKRIEDITMHHGIGYGFKAACT